MCINHLAYGIDKLFLANLFRESECKWYIVLNRIGVSLALGEYTLLGKGERNTFGLRFFISHFLILSISHFHQLSDDLVLDTLQCTALHQRFCIERDAIALIHLYGELDGRDGC